MRARRTLEFLLILSAIAVMAVALAEAANAHLIRKPDHPRKSVLENRLVSQKENLAHARYVCAEGGGLHKRWACHAVGWLEGELAETRSALVPPRAWRETVEAWLPTFRCENGEYGWHANTGNGFYGGLQFDYGTWVAHGGQQFAPRADLAAPWQQALVASRLTYDGWPNCPNP